MTMDKLTEMNVDDLQAALATASTVKAAKRLMIALAYTDGVRVETLSERHDIPRATVYWWLARFEHHSINEAIEDESRPGRPSKLNALQRERLSTGLSHLNSKNQRFRIGDGTITYIYIISYFLKLNRFVIRQR